MNDETKRTCEVFTHAVEAGEDRGDVVGYLAEQYGVQRPAIWRRLRAGGALPPYEPLGSRPHSRSYTEKNERDRASAGRRAARREAMDSRPRINRDPCPRCGVRGDIACGHSRAPLGMTL